MVYTGFMEKPLVSIALATYNGERFLKEQLDSLLAQTYGSFEIVVTDDGSSDDTCNILQEYANRDSRIRWQHSKNERGFINNFTGALKLCKGQIIFLCDQDDVWYPEKIEKHVECYKDPSVEWAYNEVRLVDEKGGSQGYMTDTFPTYYSKERRWVLNYVWGSCILGCATSYRASAIQTLLPPDKHAPAHDSWLQMALWPSAPAEVKEVLQDYRMHGANTSNFKLSRPKDEEKRMEEQAIKDNFIRLKSFSRNPRLAIWKRLLFLTAYIAKHLRLVYRGPRSIIM